MNVQLAEKSSQLAQRAWKSQRTLFTDLEYIFFYLEKNRNSFSVLYKSLKFFWFLFLIHVDWRSSCFRAGSHHIERSEFPQWTHGLKSPHGSLLCAGHILGNRLPVGLVRLLWSCQRDQMHAVDGRLWAVYSIASRRKREFEWKANFHVSNFTFTLTQKYQLRVLMIYQKFTTTIGWCRKHQFACLCGFRVWHSRNAPLTVTLTTFTLILCCFMSRIFSSSLTRQ